MKSSIIVNQLTKQYGNRTVVDQLSFSVQPGEVFGLLGHNGAGKSTTIEMILGLKKPDHGSASILGMDARKHKKQLFEQVGVQLQASNYQNTIRVNEICEEFSMFYKKPRDYHEILERFGLKEFEKEQVSKLSGGEKQKLSLVLALLPSPKVIFLDELTTGLDAAARRHVWKLLKELKEEGTTILLTTHYMEEAEALCDRICLIKEGKQLAMGTTKDVIDTSPYHTLEDAYLWHMGEEVMV